ncbi:MAG TPA: cytochrome c biogenesis protein CcsA [Gemmataceae bacterium]|nr:cytochrome c biogenesis protein CcsA [Gemmataceae bacterium]
MKANFFVPVITVSVFGIYLLGASFMPDLGNGKKDFDLAGARQIPVVDGGRVKPLDTVARTALRIVSGRESFYIGKEEQPAIRWALDVMSFDPDDKDSPVWNYEVFRIENDQVLNLLGLKPKEGFRYKLKDFSDKFEKLQAELDRIKKVPENNRTLYDNKIVQLKTHLDEFLKLRSLHDPLLLPPGSAGEEWRSLQEVEEEIGFKAIQTVMIKEGILPKDVKNLPPEEQKRLRREVQEEDARQLAAIPAAHEWRELLDAYRENKPADFNRLVAGYSKNLSFVPNRDQERASFEVFFNRAAPFYQCCFLYAAAAIIGCLSWMVWSEPLRRTAFWLMVLTALPHTFGLIARMYIQGRPPVTNLYSSAIFIGWGAVLGSLVMERLFPIGIANVVGAIGGFATSIIAHNLGSGNDTLQMMQAVLDTNFWLSTHVTCVTTGYAATFVAGLLGIVFIILGLFTPKLDKSTFKLLGQMIYGVVCFATFLSFTGTVLGGIWADQSWGRFWGWDPKENGAILIVLWNAIVLHARWCGLVQQRGMAIMTVFGNIVTSWSWFGTNMLGIGLHAYGFMEAAVPSLIIFDISQVAIMGIGLIPPKHWASFGGRYEVETKAKEPVREAKREPKPVPVSPVPVNIGSTAVTARRPR